MSTRSVAIFAAIIFISLVGLWGLQSYSPYQINCTPQSILGVDVEGVLSTENLNLEEPYNRIWDSHDLVIPLEKDRFLIATNIAIRDQHVGTCPENENVAGAKCTSDSDCSNKILKNGLPTGNCTKTDESLSTCEMRGWCPAAFPTFPLGESVPLFEDVKDFLLKLENEVLFPDCEGLPNMITLQGKDFETNCVYNKGQNPNCPNIPIGDIIEGAGADTKNIFKFGGLFSVTINWDCDFDDHVDECRPQYTFKKIIEGEDGNPVRHNTVNIRTGGKDRTLTDYIGVKISIKVEGTFSKTNYTTFVLTLIAAFILVLCLFGGILGVSYYVFYSWIRGTERRPPQVMENRTVQEFSSVQCKN